MVSPLTVLISQTFFVEDSGNFERSLPKKRQLSTKETSVEPHLPEFHLSNWSDYLISSFEI